MRRPREPADYVELRDGEVTLYVDPVSLEGHVRDGVLEFYFGMFGQQKLRLEQAR
jgi:hypothetical protein